MQAHQKFKHIKKNQAVKHLDASKIDLGAPKIELGVSKIELDASKIKLGASKIELCESKTVMRARCVKRVRARHLAHSLNPTPHNYERESKVLLLSKNQLMFN